MTNTPLSSGEQTRVFLFMLLIILAVPALVGILPALFLLFGFALLKRNQDFSAIEVSAKLVLGYLWIGLLIAAKETFGLGSSYAEEFGTGDWHEEMMRDYFINGLIVCLIIIAYIISVHYLFLSPLRSHRDWVAVNGIFSKTPRQEGAGKKTSEVRVVNVEGMRSYSVADELSKWAKLRDEGVVSEQEFQEARAKILRSQ